MTKQSFKKECDVNSIVKAFERNGVITHVNQREGQYGDFTMAPEDYQEAVQSVMDAQEMFDELPSEIRRFFDNDPEEFMRHHESDDAKELMQKYGLRKPEEIPVIEPVTQPKGDPKEPAEPFA